MYLQGLFGPDCIIVQPDASDSQHYGSEMCCVSAVQQLSWGPYSGSHSHLL